MHVTKWRHKLKAQIVTKTVRIRANRVLELPLALYNLLLKTPLRQSLLWNHHLSYKSRRKPLRLSSSNVSLNVRMRCASFLAAKAYPRSIKKRSTVIRSHGSLSVTYSPIVEGNTYAYFSCRTRYIPRSLVSVSVVGLNRCILRHILRLVESLVLRNDHRIIPVFRVPYLISVWWMSSRAELT